MLDLYQYKASLIRLVDADTLFLQVSPAPIDIGFDIQLTAIHKDKFRLNRLDAYKKGTPRGDAGIAFMQKELEKRLFIIKTIKDKKEKWGRYLVEIFVNGGNLNDLLVKNELAVYWDAEGPRPAGLKERHE